MKDIHDIQFNLEKWQTGEYDVFTREGDEVTQLTYFDANDPSKRGICIAGVVDDSFKTWSLDGQYYKGKEHSNDLFLRPKVKTRWHNVWVDPDGLPFVSSNGFDSKEEAMDSIPKVANYLKTIAVTNERES